MKVKIFIIQIICLFAFTVQAKHVTVENAQSTAQKYFSQTAAGVTLRSARASFTLAYTAKKETDGVNIRSGQAGEENACFYIFNTPDNGGFVIIAADDRAYPVLGYSFKGAFDYDKAPPVFVQWLTDYQKEIEKTLNANPQLEANPEWQKIGDDIMLRAAGTTLGTAEWNQNNPYNLQCPTVGGQRTVTGCVATAMAIVMKYHADHGFAAIGTGSHSYTWNGQTLTASFGTFDWANMPNNTNGFTNDTQRNAVARLMSHCGISIEADYGVGGTSASTSDIANALIQFFGYNQSASYLSQASFSDTEWKGFIKTEVDASRPIIYRGSGDAGGHAFVCEGYTVNDEYAFNWGWGGYCNGFFRLNALQPINGYNFSEGQRMVIGIKKALGNTDDINQIWLTISGGGKGMSKSVEIITQNQQFTVTAGALENTSYNAFRGKIAVVLTDASDNIKEVISSSIDLTGSPLNPNYYVMPVPISLSCKITKTIDPTDLIRMVSTIDNGATWKIIKGKTGTVDFLTVGAQNVAVIGVTLNSNAQTLIVGETFQLTPTITPANATNKNVKWTSSDANVAEVNSSGLVIAKTVGRVTITVTTVDGGKMATCTITVQPGPVSSVSLNSNAETLTVGETFQLTPTITPATATNKNVTWTSSDANVAEVNSSGLVTARAAGTATITVKTVDGGKTATCTITVQPGPVSGVSLNSNAETLTVGETFQLTPTITPANATNKNVTWTSSDANVAEVNSSGLVTARAAGTATITVTTVDSGKKAMCTFTVVNAGPYIDFGNEKSVRITRTNNPGVDYLYEDGTSRNSVNTKGITYLGLYNRYDLSNVKDVFKLKKVGISGDKILYTLYSNGEGTGNGGGGYLTDATDLAFDSNGSVKDADYIWNSKWVRLSFEKVQNANSVFAFRRIQLNDNSDFLIETATGGYICINNNCLVVAKMLYSDALLSADIFAMEEAPVSTSGWFNTPTGNEKVSSGLSDAWLQSGALHVTGSVAEDVTIFSLSGNLLYQAKKSEGEATFMIGDLPKGVLIVCGSSGWVWKVVKN